MDNTPNRDQGSKRHDRVAVYACAVTGEVGISLHRQIRAARADARKNSAQVQIEIAESVRRSVAPLDRSGLLQAIRVVRAWGPRGVLLAVAPEIISGGSRLALAQVMALVEGTEGAVVTIQPIWTDRIEYLRLTQAVEAMESFAEQREQFRQRDDVVALRRTATWPLDVLPGSSPESPEAEGEE